MERPPALPAHMEIANLEHRLVLLHDRRQAFAKQSDTLKWMTSIAIPVLAVVVAWLAFATQTDPVPMLVVFSIMISASALLAWMYRHSDWSVELNRFGPRNRYTSYRVFLEESIKDCENALAELKAKS